MKPLPLFLERAAAAVVSFSVVFLLGLGALSLVIPREAEAQVSSTYVKRAGDTMNGPLKLNTGANQRDPLVLNSGANAVKGICFNSSCSWELVADVTGSSGWGVIGGGRFGFGGTFQGYVFESTYANSAGVTITGANSYLKIAGGATGSLPTCDGTTIGGQIYDTTTNTMKWCNGSAWQSFGTGAGTVTEATEAWQSICFNSPCSGEAADFTGSIRRQRGTIRRVSCSWNVVGVGGTTGVVVRVRNKTAGTTACSCTVGACTTAINTPVSCACAGGAYVDGEDYTVQLDSTTDCGTNPGQIVCSTESVVTN